MISYCFRVICDRLLVLLRRPGDAGFQSGNKVLNAPVNIASLAANNVNEAEEMKSIWVNQREEGLVRKENLTTS